MDGVSAEWDCGVKTSGFHSACVNSWYRPMITKIRFDEDHFQTVEAPEAVTLGPTQLMFETVPAHEFYEMNKIDGKIVDLLDDLLLNFRLANLAGPWVAGGLLRRALQGETLANLQGDVDIFVNNPTQQEEIKQHLGEMKEVFHIAEAQHEAENCGVGPDGKMIHSPYADSFFYEYLGTPIKIQIINFKSFNSLQQLFAHFDTFCCMVGSDGVNVTYERGRALEDLKSKKLHFNWPHLEDRKERKTNSYLLMKRLTKFISEGYNVDNNDLKRLTALIHNLPITTYSRQRNEYNNL